MEILRNQTDKGIRDPREAWRLIAAVTSDLPDDERVSQLRNRMLELLQTIEIESILGTDCAPFRRQLSALLDWVEAQQKP